MNNYVRSTAMRKTLGIVLVLLFTSLFFDMQGTVSHGEVPVVSAPNGLPQIPSATTSVVVTHAAAPSVSSEEKWGSATYHPIDRVIDGDTVIVDIDGVAETIRVIGLDTPETVDPRKTVQCFGVEASNKAKELLLGRRVRIEKDPTQGERDKYGRLLAYLYREDGLFFNKYMIERGYANEYTYVLPYRYQAEFRSAERFARSGQLGLWAPSACNGVTTSDSTLPPRSAPSAQAAGGYYTSSYHSSAYYYPADCEGREALSPEYLQNFATIDALLAVYPSRTLSPGCSIP